MSLEEEKAMCLEEKKAMCFAEDKMMHLAEEIVALLKKNDLKLTTAESCTVGMIASTLINVPGISDYYEEGYITYANKAKVKLLSVEDSPEGKVLIVSGADMMDGTPVYDIKPYLPYVDSIPEAIGGFTEEKAAYSLQVDFPAELLQEVPENQRETLLGVLAQDPRPAYQNDENRVYGFAYGSMDVRFTVRGGTLTVVEIVKE